MDNSHHLWKNNPAAVSQYILHLQKQRVHRYSYLLPNICLSKFCLVKKMDVRVSCWFMMKFNFICQLQIQILHWTVSTFTIWNVCHIINPSNFANSITVQNSAHIKVRPKWQLCERFDIKMTWYINNCMAT